MPIWTPEALWQGQEVFIIGGGDSLRHFDWNLLVPELTIGCNTAYQHGVDICKICVFGDSKWWFHHKAALTKYEGAVFTNVPRLYKDRTPWLWIMYRRARGLHHNALGWNWNTGAVAINLALLLGADVIYLLGFDMQLSKGGSPNWHDQLLDRPNPGAYNRFQDGFKWVAKDLEEKFPGRKVFNITNDSKLDTFPKINFDSFWKERQVKKAG